ERNILAINDCFYRETLAYFKEHRLQAGDVIFIPTITKGQLLGSARLVADLAGHGIRFIILLRYQRAFYEGSVAERAFRLLERCAPRGSVELCTDSHRLAVDLGSLTRLEIRVFPIPHTDRRGSDDGSQLKTDRPVHFVSLGNARGEKGLAEILGAAN